MPPNLFKCRPCGEVQAGGGFVPGEGVVICSDKVNTRSQVVLGLRHELVHAYDHCRSHVNWEDIDHHACAEIRASNLSGECYWMQEIQRGNFKWDKQHQVCVKRRAALSLKNGITNPTDEQIAGAIERVFQQCFRDTRPFDRLP